MILVKLTDESSNIFYISDVGIQALDSSTMKFWKPKLNSVSPVSMRPDEEYGGMIRIQGAGSISIMPDTFSWPLPIKIIVDVRYVDSYGTITNLFLATGMLKYPKSEELVYNLYNPELDIDALEDAPDWPVTGPTEENRVYPIVFGNIALEIPLRVSEDDDYVYYKAGLDGSDPDSDYTVYDDGRQKLEYDGSTYQGTIVNIDGDTFKSVVYNDTNIANKPFGDIRMTGTNANISDLDEFFTWATNRLASETSDGWTLNTSKSRSPSPNINFYQTEQINLLDFMSNVSAFFTHCFYIDTDNYIVYLIDMFVNNGSKELTKGINGVVANFFDASYEYQDPLKKLSASWEYFEITTDQDGYPIFVDNEAIKYVNADNTFGIEKDFKPYTKIEADIVTALINIGILLQAPIAEVTIPYDFDTVIPGKKYSWTDTAMNQTGTVSIRTRTIEFRPLDSETKIMGNIISS